MLLQATPDPGAEHSPWKELPVTPFGSRVSPDPIPVPASLPPTPLEVIRLEHSSWQISNAAMDASDPTRIMGFIERLDEDRFEVRLLVSPIGWAYVENFGLAVVAFADRARFVGDVGPDRDPDASSRVRL